jgi:hypothetical protein
MTIPTQAVDLTVSTHPTQADAQIMIQLAQLATSMQIDRGDALLRHHREQGGLTYEQFNEAYKAPSPDGSAILAVLKWHETVGTLVKQGLLDRGLVLDWLWVAGSWEQCRAIALGQRAETGIDAMWENFEALAAAQTD